MDKPRQERLGQLLLENNLLTSEELDEALKEQVGSGKSLGRVLVEKKLLTEGQLTSILAEQIGMKYVDLNSYPIDPSAAGMVDAEIAKRHTLIPINMEDGKLVVAMADPTNVYAIDDLRIMTGMDVTLVVSAREDIEAAIGRYLHEAVEVGEVLEGMEELEELVEEEEAVEAGEEAPIVKYVNLVIEEAVGEGASDIHIEPGERDVRIRYRIDGVLHEIRRSPRRIHPGMVSRVKILANMNIAERRVPQDGRFAMRIGDKAIDFRVASIPTVYGEKLVLRLLDRASMLMSLEDLGVETLPLKKLSDAFHKPYGTVIVSGPTGSGKTTTLYAILSELNRREVNTITVEDPVEYQLRGVNQVQVNTKVGLTFASALRSILRCDPDVVMVGEIRDPESAKMAIESALTGHMVLCTLHTNDAPSAMTRMTEMGVEPFLIASAVDCVVSQRLARRLCGRCKEKAEYEPAYLEKIGFPVEDTMTIYKAKEGGCPFCNGMGYRGRIGLFEVMSIDEEIEKLVVDRATGHEIGRLAISKGMSTLREDGYVKVKSGITSIEEVLRVVM
ncbi:MAG: ATPase, T2SS/T4P/T4SS family [Actinomycetota bacterium]|nr:ATPase, T2SS/T4P/T4SS family [Actinomycetota bacterium]